MKSYLVKLARPLVFSIPLFVCLFLALFVASDRQGEIPGGLFSARSLSERAADADASGEEVLRAEEPAKEARMHDSAGRGDVKGSLPVARYMIRPTVSREQVLRFGYVLEDKKGIKEGRVFVLPPARVAEFCPQDQNASGAVSSHRSKMAVLGDEIAQTDDAPHFQKVFSFALPTSGGGNPPESSGIRVIDLSFFPWSGQEVAVCVRATNADGGAAGSEPVRLVMQRRVFRDPLAREVLSLRQDLLDRGDYARNVVVNGVDLLISEVENESEKDFTGVLVLALLRNRLDKAEGADSLEEAAQLMWQTAVHFDKTDTEALAARAIIPFLP